MKYAEEHPVPLDFTVGEGHKRLLMDNITTSQNVYMSSFGFTPEQIASFTADNFFVVVDSKYCNKNCGNNGMNGAGTEARFLPASYNYDSSTGILTVTAATLYHSLRGSHDGSPYPLDESVLGIATSIYIIY